VIRASTREIAEVRTLSHPGIRRRLSRRICIIAYSFFVSTPMVWKIITADGVFGK